MVLTQIPYAQAWNHHVSLWCPPQLLTAVYTMLPLQTDRRKEGEYFSKAHYHCKQYYSLCPTIMKEQPAFCSTLFIPSSSPSSNLQLKRFACLPDFTIHIKGWCKFQCSLEKEYRNFPTESNLCWESGPNFWVLRQIWHSWVSLGSKLFTESWERRS